MTTPNLKTDTALARAAARLHARLARDGITIAPDVAVEVGRLLRGAQDRAILLQSIGRAEVYLGQMRKPPSRDLLLEGAAAFFGRRDWNALSAVMPAGNPSLAVTNQHPLPLGTPIRAFLSQMDEGDFGERHTLPGAVGFIVGVMPKQKNCYHVAFEPSGVLGFWSAAEVDALAEVLPVGHSDIPSSVERSLSLAMRDIFYDCEEDDDQQNVLVTAEIAIRLRAAASTPGTPDALRSIIAQTLPTVSEFSTTTVAFTTVNRIAELAGVGDRFPVFPADADKSAPLASSDSQLLASSVQLGRLLAAGSRGVTEASLARAAGIQPQGLAGTLRQMIARAPQDATAETMTFSTDEMALLGYLAAADTAYSGGATAAKFDAVIPFDRNARSYELSFEQVDRLAEAMGLPDRLLPTSSQPKP